MQAKNREKVTPMRDFQLLTDITTWLERLGEESQNTKINYERSIRFFFNVMLGKELEHLTLEDIQIRRADVDKFVTKMSKMKKNRGTGTYSTSTINQTLDRVSALYKNLAVNEYPVNPLVFHKAGKKEKDAEKHPSLTWEQVEIIMDTLKEDKENGQAYALLVEVAVKTCFRKEALLSLTSQDFTRLNENLWLAKVYDKTDWHEKPIKADLYERLIALSQEHDNSDGRLFPFTSEDVRTMVEQVREKVGIHFVFHSFKKAGMQEVHHITGGDIKAIQQMGNHKDPTTAIEYYLEFNKDWENHPALQIGKELDDSEFERLSHEELLDMIKNSNRFAKMQLLNSIKTK